MEKKRKILLYFIFAVLTMPLLEQEFGFITSGALKGGFRNAQDSAFTLKSWWNGTFQPQREKYLNDAVGFRPDLVRLTNQIDFSLFDICHSGWTVKGKDQYLFQWPYINAYYGLDFSGPKIILDRCRMMRALQDTFSKMGKSFVLAYLPSKASSYPEYFPDDRVVKHPGPTNYTVYRHIADSLGINQIDLDAWFVSMKHTCKEPLFSKQGIHWTTYGAILGGDSLTRYLEHLQNIHMRHPDWTKMIHSDSLRGGDDDIAVELNLIFPEAHETLAYPIIEDVPNDTGKKINAVYIGDSYAHKMIEFGIVHKMNNRCEFWSYFNEVHDINGHGFYYINEYDWIGALERADCIVLSYTLFNFYHLGDGFIENAYNHYFPAKK
jgi:SGNH hydrolase-like domain, acetyltransferase AlgX